MGSINRSHIEANGGVLLFSGELVLLYCDSVSCEIGGKESFKGRVYLTTHRLVVVIHPFRQNAPVKSFCAPFCAIIKCGVEQPIFGANYIEATVRDETDPNKSFSFKLKFKAGGAIELAMAMNRAVQLVGRNYNPTTPPPPAYTPSPSAQYYQAPPTVYAPGFNSGVSMPTQLFPDQPPIGFIYASDAPPPYPGIGGHQQPQQHGSTQPGFGQGQQQPPWGSSNNVPGAGYPGSYQSAQPSQQPWGGYPGPQQPPQQSWSGYPGPQQPPQQSWGGYPSAQGPQAPSQPSNIGYPGSGGYPTSGGYPGSGGESNKPPQQQPPSSAGYPDLGGVGNNANPGQQPSTNQQQYPQQSANSEQSWPSAPSINPNWQDDKKNV